MIVRVLVWIMMLAGLSACAATPDGVLRDAQAQEPVSRSYRVTQFNYNILPDLKVSESNQYYPVADVVWRGDPAGDGERVAQIGAMFNEAIRRNGARLQGDVPVVVDVQLIRFHGVTDRTRYSVGGNYNIIFAMTVRNAATGAVIEPARRIDADLDAPGGRRARELEQSGQTQKVRVTDFLTQVLFDELS